MNTSFTTRRAYITATSQTGSRIPANRWAMAIPTPAMIWSLARLMDLRAQ
jgi:hypothetical protein